MNHHIETIDRGHGQCRVQITDAATGKILRERDHVAGGDVDLLIDHLVYEITERPRYVIAGGAGEWYRASVWDTRHVRGQSPTRRKIPCADLRTAIEVARELNTGTCDLN